MENDTRMKNANGEPKFQVECDAGSAGHLRLATHSLSITVGQRVLRDGEQEMWESIAVNCEEAEDGSLSVRVTAFHPEWEEGREIALFQSRPMQANLPVLTFSHSQR